MNYKNFVQVVSIMLVAAVTLLVVSVPAFATESTMIIQLQNKIKSNVNDFKVMNKEYLERQKEMKEADSRAREKVAEETKPERRMEAAREYYLYKAQSLHLLAGNVAKFEDKIDDMVCDMDRLEKLVRKGEAKEVNILGKESVAAFKSTVGGISNLLDAAKKMNPELEFDSSMVTARNTLLNLNSRYRDMNKHGAEFNLRKQIDYLVDMRAYLNSAAKLIERETLHIRTDIYQLVQIEMEKSADEIFAGIAEFQVSLDQNHTQSNGVIDMVRESYDYDQPRKTHKVNSNTDLRNALKW